MVYRPEEGYYGDPYDDTGSFGSMEFGGTPPFFFPPEFSFSLSGTVFFFAKVILFSLRSFVFRFSYLYFSFISFLSVGLVAPFVTCVVRGLVYSFELFNFFYEFHEIAPNITMFKRTLFISDEFLKLYLDGLLMPSPSNDCILMLLSLQR